MMPKEKSRPAPLETTPGQQQDDNIDDLGRKRGGLRQDQPTGEKDVNEKEHPKGKRD